MNNDDRHLQKKLGYTFKNENLLNKALTHRSYRYEEESVEVDNQRLEFLGDAALGLISAAHLFEAHQQLKEGALTKLRSQITSSRALSRIAKKIELGPFILLGRGEKQSGGETRASNLTDAMEAILGAAYLDGDMNAVRLIFNKLFVPELEAAMKHAWADNPKGYLQELCQKKWKISPRYKTVHEEGPPHDKTYTIVVEVNQREMGQGIGPNKRQAEIEAAQIALETIDTEEASS